MVTNLREGSTVKCEQYWPDKGRDFQQLGPFKIATVAEEIFPHYAIRKITLKVRDIMIVAECMSE